VAKEITVEVAYALPERQALVTLVSPVGTTVGEAIEQSGLLPQFPEIDLKLNKVGIFGKIVALTTVLRDGDRVEIYRPLTADPKAIRRLRAAQGRELKRRSRRGVRRG
jgi:uncharacterized protein